MASSRSSHTTENGYYLDAQTGHSDNLEWTESAPPPLLIGPRRSQTIPGIGSTIAILDAGVMPIVYFYAFKYGTSWSLQESMLHTCQMAKLLTKNANSICSHNRLFGLFGFIHYVFRSFRLFLGRNLVKFGPLEWTRWGLLEFFHVNVAFIIFLLEVELIIGTAPKDPILRLCAMTSATASYYLGVFFLYSSIMASLCRLLPFNMSSVSKGMRWRPVLYAFVEDFIANEMRGEKASRSQMMRRYETSSRFRKMITTLSWCWGVGFLIVAISTTVLVMVLPENIVFGVGWGLPHLCFAIMAAITVVFVKWSLRREREFWRRNVQDRGLIHREAHTRMNRQSLSERVARV